MSMNVIVIIVLSVLIISSFFYCKYKQFPLNVQGGNPYFFTETADTRRIKPIQTCLFPICHAQVANFTTTLHTLQGLESITDSGRAPAAGGSAGAPRR